MSEFSELIKNFNKLRDYTREFFLYGFKSRNDFLKKSSRSYDNERRRLESYLGEYFKSSYTKNGKSYYISLSTAKLKTNPLFKIWKSKSFTDNDIMLHFYILDILQDEKELTVFELTNIVCERSELIFDTQTVRNKCNEYVENEILEQRKDGKTFLYSLSKNEINLNTESVINAISYFQNDSPFGFIGSTILDKLNVKDSIFTFKHLFIMNTLDENMLYKTLQAIKSNNECVFSNYSSRTKKVQKIQGLPLKILTSTQSGRNYVAIYKTDKKRFSTIKLSNIIDIKILGKIENFNEIKNNLDKNLHKCWGVTFDKGSNAKTSQRDDYIKLTLKIDENYEQYILTRLLMEGRGGSVEKICDNTFLYYKEVFDANEMSPFIKSFIGRIISLDTNNEFVLNKFNNDMKKMFEMYS